MKKIAVITSVFVLALALSACGVAQPAASSASSEPEAEVVSASAQDTSASASSAPAQHVNEIKWTTVESADEAAKGAGFDKFGVMDSVKLNDTTFSNPTFAYAGGVAQAYYEMGAMGLDVRKADGKHDAPLTDRDTTEFAEKWTSSYEDLDVTLYGSARGAATVATWSDGTQDFGVTFQGLGGEEVTMNAEEINGIVKALKEANTTAAAQEEKKEEPQQEQQAAQPAEQEQAPAQQQLDNYLTVADVENIIFQNGLGQYNGDAILIEGNDGVWYWQATVSDTSGNPHTIMVDPNGVVTVLDSGEVYPNDGSNTQVQTENYLTEADVQNIIWSNGLGEYTGAFLIEGNDGVWYWQATTLDTQGNEHTWMVDPNGVVNEV